MKFALVGSQRKEAEPKEIGVCICCGNQVRAYCGQQRVNHWKHINLIECDQWSEGETEWHRNWKNYFENTQQEFVRFDNSTGEKHIADIYIESKDLVIEFQHSPINIEEIIARENFYKKMIWVIDLKDFSKNINFYDDIKEVFGETVEYPWAIKEDAKYRQLKKEGKIEEAEKLRKDRSGWDYLQTLEKKYSQYSFRENYFLMIWKYQHKRWDMASMPIFFDLNDAYIYFCIESIKVSNSFIVKRFLKEDFIAHYRTK